MLLRLKKKAISERLSLILKDSKFSDAFNPSIAILDGEINVTFRACKNPDTGRFNAYYVRYRENRENYRLYNLSELVVDMGVENVADPKVFCINKEIWVTFNTGYSMCNNRLFIMQLYPKVDQPIECHFPGRNTIEKNWAFFKKDNVLHALYSCNPVIVLKADNFDPYSNAIDFSIAYREERPRNKGCLSIGTQLLQVDNEFRFVAHRKIKPLLTRRSYFGLAAILKSKDGIFEVDFSKKYLIHSISDLIGSGVKHNKNLLSCTYFSGIEARGDKTLLSYGINDTGWSLSEVEWASLW